MNIYIDMDDVVADFNAYARSVLNKSQESEKWPEAEWQRLKDNPRMYRDLPVKDNAHDLVNWLLNARIKHSSIIEDVKFLTAVPKNNDVHWAFYDKVRWAQLHFPQVPVMFGPFSKDKQVHCRPGDILIDDRLSNCTEWRDRGGLAHQYRAWPECKQWLEEILK
jgi:hypothetical protein